MKTRLQEPLLVRWPQQWFYNWLYLINHTSSMPVQAGAYLCIGMKSFWK